MLANRLNQKRVLTIQDVSCVGRCSLTVALPILSAAGLETSILPTAILSTHTGGFTGYTYRDLTSDIAPIAEHWESLGLKFDALYTGYLGSFEQLELVSSLFDRFKLDGGIILIDPVMGDNGALYTGFTPEFAASMARLCAKSDVVVPNLTEAAFMLNEPYIGEGYDSGYIEGVLTRLRGLGANSAVLTGVSFEPGKIGVATLDGGAVEYYFTERVDGYFHGTGDVYASVLLAYLGRGLRLHEAAAKAADFTLECIKLQLMSGGEPRYGVPFELCLGLLTR
ncbi:MAG: pyridoxamine kinase [Oscillospiraceae bacterium]|jgi:pyridoxine kinase|nr:pyridoxamine kinase [Oscillospiraceae bacterium]